MSAGQFRSPTGPSVADEALGALEAQRVIDLISTGNLTGQHAWLKFCELASARGWKSSACRALVVELAKRAAR